MKKLIVIRHAQADLYSGDLTPRGVLSLRPLERFLYEQAQGKVCEFITSTSARAMQTAEILSKEIDCGAERDPQFFVPDEQVYAEQIEHFKKRMEGCLADILIIVTHNPMIYSIQTELSQTFEDQLRVPLDLDTAQGLMFDFETQDVSLVP